ncbi:MAG TPA: hypothetical protein VEY70_03640, partial [Metabacillus sp.]|nr:hypothetical protein [Metabacillus sp.]
LNSLNRKIKANCMVEIAISCNHFCYQLQSLLLSLAITVLSLLLSLPKKIAANLATKYSELIRI